MSIERTPTAFRHRELGVVQDALTKGLAETMDVTESIELFIENIISVLEALKTSSERSGFALDPFMEQFCNIIDVLDHSGYRIVAAIAKNTELEV